MKQLNEDVSVKIDIDKGIALWNEKYPDQKISRKDVEIHEGLSRGVILNLKKGKFLNTLTAVFKFLKRTNLKFNDITTVTDGKGQDLL